MIYILKRKLATIFHLICHQSLAEDGCYTPLLALKLFCQPMSEKVTRYVKLWNGDWVLGLHSWITVQTVRTGSVIFLLKPGQLSLPGEDTTQLHVNASPVYVCNRVGSYSSSETGDMVGHGGEPLSIAPEKNEVWDQGTWPLSHVSKDRSDQKQTFWTLVKKFGLLPLLFSVTSEESPHCDSAFWEDAKYLP